MPIMTYELLRQIAKEGLSVNGSEGLGGHGDGFEIQNQGVTRRQPGEGPKVNGGSTIDQPRYENESAEDEPEVVGDGSPGEIELINDPEWSEEEQTFGTTQGDSIKVQIGGRHPMDVLRTVAHELSHWEHEDTDGSDGSEEENRANAEAGENMRKFAKEFPEMFKNEGRSVWDAIPDPMQLAKEPVGTQQDYYNVGIGDDYDEKACPTCGGKEDPMWPCEGCGGTGTYEGWLNVLDKASSADEPKDWRDQEIDEEFMGVRDPETIEKQDTRVGSQECGGQVAEKIDPEELKKSSEKEKKEHPWASKKIANRIARDHMKEHKVTLKEFFQVDEMARPGRYKYTDPQGKEYDQDAFSKHIDTNYPKKHGWDYKTGADAEKELTTTGGWKKDRAVHTKPPLEQAVGKYIHVDQFSSITPYKIQEHGITYDDLPEEMFADGDGMYIDDDPNASWGSFVLSVGQNGELTVDSYNVDSSG